MLWLTNFFILKAIFSKMSETEVMDLKGIVRLRIHKVAELGAEAKFSPTVKIAKLPW